MYYTEHSSNKVKVKVKVKCLDNLASESRQSTNLRWLYSTYQSQKITRDWLSLPLDLDLDLDAGFWYSLCPGSCW